MTSHWYCTDCEERIEKTEIDEHEDQGHEVRGKIRPDRLLENDPWQVGGDVEATDGGDEP